MELVGAFFLWDVKVCEGAISKGDKHDVAARLDRFLVSNKWDVGFKNIKQSVLLKVTSDHTPILLQSGNWEPVKSYFKFENWWLHTEGFFERVKEWWISITCEGRPDFIIAFKLNILKNKGTGASLLRAI